MNTENQITFRTTDHGYETVGGKFHCDIIKQRSGRYHIWRNGRCYTSNTLEGAKNIARNLALFGG